MIEHDKLKDELEVVKNSLTKTRTDIKKGRKTNIHVTRYTLKTVFSFLLEVEKLNDSQDKQTKSIEEKIKSRGKLKNHFR